MIDEQYHRNQGEGGLEDPILAEALRNFRGSVHTWSEVAYNRPRPALASTHRIAWRRSIVWILSLVLSLGILGTAAWERHHQGEIARQHQQQREQEREQQLARQQAATQQTRAPLQAQESEDLMARVDSDVSREVPAAMEPLAQLMTDDDIR